MVICLDRGGRTACGHVAGLSHHIGLDGSNLQVVEIVGIVDVLFVTFSGRLVVHGGLIVAHVPYLTWLGNRFHCHFEGMLVIDAVREVSLATCGIVHKVQLIAVHGVEHVHCFHVSVNSVIPRVSTLTFE